MQLSPVYGPDPILTLDVPPSDILVPTVRQRERLVTVLESLDEEQWAHATRCDGWTVRDVIVHLDSTNGFWSYSIASGLQGAPSEVLAAFDPVATPAAIVEASDVTTGELLEQFSASSQALCDLLRTIEGDAWLLPAEAPPGHLSMTAVAHHALWDSWIHERDISIPMGMAPATEPDEVASCLWYAAALSPAFAVNSNPDLTGGLAVSVTDPDLALIVELDGGVTVRRRDERAGDSPDLTLTGDAVELVESLSQRCEMKQEIPPEQAWMLSGLAEVFDQA